MQTEISNQDNLALKAHRYGDAFGLKLMLLVLAMTVVVFIWTSRHYQSAGPQKDTWVDEQGHLHVLGITLGVSSLRDAELALQSRSEVALYLYPAEHPKAGMRLEAYFPAIADHTRVILQLGTSNETLKMMEVRASVPQQFESGVARLALDPKDAELANRFIVQELTLIPSIALTAADLTARFGAPSTTRQSASSKTALDFPALGLKAELNEGESPQLHFSQPLRPD
jgi:hypothetical protein